VYEEGLSGKQDRAPSLEDFKNRGEEKIMEYQRAWQERGKVEGSNPFGGEGWLS